jgi:hypothetical protein
VTSGRPPPAPSFIIHVTHSEPALTIAQEHTIEDDNSTQALTLGGKEITSDSRGAEVTDQSWMGRHRPRGIMQAERKTQPREMASSFHLPKSPEPRVSTRGIDTLEAER